MNIVNKKNILIISITKSLIICLLGFGVLNIFWLNMTHNPEMKGLYDYYAATLGDGVFLPVVVGAGSYFVDVNKVISHYKYHKVILGIVVLFGSGMQVSWLLNPNIELNWTIDKVYSFNMAGWYHAFYFVGMFGVITHIILRAVYVNRNSIVQCKNSYVLMWLAMYGYWNMHLLDDCLTNSNYLVYGGSSIIFALLIYVLLEKKMLYTIKNKTFIHYIIGLVCITCFTLVVFIKDRIIN